MADYEEQVSSTTSLGDELITQVGPHHGMGDSNEAVSNDRFNVNEIVDLVGGAQDAIERHIAEGSAPIDDTELFSKQPEPEYEPVTVSEPEQVALPVLGEPEAEPSAAPQTTVTEDATELTKEEAAPEPATLVEPSEEPVVAPTAKPESTEIVAPQSVIQEPIPSPIAVAPVAPPTATASLTREEDSAVAPVSHAPSLPKPPAAALMHFPTELGQKGDSPAPISPLSPLHSPDSLEELSLTESPNQPPASWASSATPLGSSSTAASQEASPRRMPWEAQESDAEPGRGKNPEGLLDPIAAPYLSLGKDPERLPYLCGDSGVSVSPEEKLLSSNKSSSGPSPINPQMKVPESHHAPSNPTDSWDTQFMASEDNSQSLIDSFSKDTAAISLSSYEAHIQASQSDDLMYEVKKNNNPFDGFSPLADAGYSHFSEAQSDSQVGKMSESPTPDLVQYRQSGDSQDSLPSFFEDKMDPHAAEQRMSQYSSGLREDDDEDEEDSPLPPSLPDILKSSPLNPDKLDSGSSEGSAEQSPVLERRMMESPNPPINLSANNPFAFDSKVSLLKEMAEETEARSNGKPQPEDDPCFGAFNLVKEAEETSPTKAKEQEPFKMEQKDWFSSHDSPKMVDNFEPLHFEGKKTADDSDSESPTADSLSPVLEAMAKNPASFQVGLEKKDQKLEVEAEVEMAEEVSEHEVSSEEFEFIERPPRGMIDEFLEALDNSKFAASRVPEIPMDEELSFEKKTSPSAAPAKAAIPTEAPDQSYLLLTQKSKAELEKPEIPQSPVQPQVDQSPASELPVIQSPASKPTEALAEKTGGARMFHMPILKMDTVGDLLYWRDVKTTGVVFGAALLLLLSLTVCSIVSVASYVALALLSVTVSFRIYKGILQAIQKSDEGHPFKLYLDQEVALSDDVTHKYSDMVLAKVNKSIVELRRLFLVEDLVDSIKFAVLMWILTYVGALFNGLTLLILVLVGVFSCPIIYEKHQVQIDHYVGMVNNQIKDIVGKIQAKVPGAKRKAE